jgi:WD40 repeat protein
MLDTSVPDAKWIILDEKMNERKSNVSAVIYFNEYDTSIYIIGGIKKTNEVDDKLKELYAQKKIIERSTRDTFPCKTPTEYKNINATNPAYINITKLINDLVNEHKGPNSNIIEKLVLKEIIKTKDTIINQAKITKNIHKSFVYSTVYNNDYSKFISTSGDSTLIIWNIKLTGAEITDITIEKILTGHEDRVVCVAWKQDNREFASGSNDCSVIVWNTDLGSIIKKYEDHDEIVRTVDYNSEGTLASGSDDKTIIVYNKEKTILHHKDRVRCIKWNPEDVNLLLSGCDDFSITLWNTRNKTIIRTFKWHTDFIYSLVWNNKTNFASSSADGTIIIWNTEKVEPIKVLTGHIGYVWSIDWKKNVLVSGGNDKKIFVWNTNTYVKQELTGHTGYVLSVNIDDKRNIISGGADNTIRVWKI